MDNTELISALMTIFKFCTDNQSGCQKTADITEETGHGANQDTAYMELKTIIEKTFSSVSSCGSQISQIEQELRTLHNFLGTEKQEDFQDKTANALSRLEKNVASLQEKMDTAHQENISRLTNENTELESKLSSLEHKNDDLNEQIKSLQSKNAELKKQFDSNLSRYEDLKELLTVKECVHSMNETNRSYIESLCEGSEFLSMISLGRDEGKIRQLWQYLRDAAVCEDGDTNHLNTYFEFCINTYNASKPESERYVFRDIAVGSEFDLNQCIKTSDSRQIGKVNKVLTRCIMRGSVVIYKAVVTVR